MLKIPFTIAEIAFYIAPVLFLLILKSLIRKRLIIRHVAIKPPDVLVPFLLIGIHILSERTLKFSLLPYFAIFMLSLGIVIVCLMAYKKGEILFSRFFKTFWRFLFLFSFLMYYILVGLNIAHHFI